MNLISNALYSKALQFYEQGNLSQALVFFNQLDPKRSVPEICQYIKLCQQKLARKFWRQGRAQDLEKIMNELNVKEHLSLAVSRLYGKEALLDLASKEEGISSQLAFSASREEIKEALIALRRIANLKSIAEGWLSILKGDLERARDSFDRASLEATLHSLVGLGVVELIEGNRSQALTFLQPLRPFAARRFPCLLQAMGWDHPEEEAQQQLSFYLYQASLEQLQSFEKNLPPHQKTVKGWINLRIGDRLALQSKPEAVSYWSKAVNQYPALTLDVLKRRYLAAYDFATDIKLHDAFFDFYRQLRKTSPGDAKSFIEHLVFDSTLPIHAHLQFINLRGETGKWLFQPMPEELQLLWLHLIHRQHLQHLEQVIYLTEEAAAKNMIVSQAEWESLFKHLDPLYSNNEQYLRRKLTVVKLLRLPSLIRDTVAKLIRLNPHLKDELLALYVKETFEQYKKILLSTHISDIPSIFEWKKNIYVEIESLRQHFSNDFDLVRLSIFFDPQLVSLEQKLSYFSPNLSESLFAVLKLQAAIDYDPSWAKCKQWLPSPSLYHKNPEADWRLISALSNRKLNSPKKKLEQLCQILAPDSDTKHLFFLNIARYRESLPHFVLNKWMQKNRRDWRPHYHLALLSKEEGDLEECLYQLVCADELISSNVHLSASIQKTLHFYNNQGLSSAEDLLEDLAKRFIGRSRS